jgi:hypothetical protein
VFHSGINSHTDEERGTNWFVSKLIARDQLPIKKKKKSRSPTAMSSFGGRGSKLLATAATLLCCDSWGGLKGGKQLYDFHGSNVMSSLNTIQ